MKTCPKCKKSYDDDSINFCLEDGATLVRKRSSSGSPSSRTNEIVAIILVGVSLLVFLCIISASDSDPSFNSATSQRPGNWIGVVGALINDWLFQAVGIVKYIIPALLALVAWRVFRAESMRPRVSRVVSYLLFVASLAGLARLIASDGGLIGAAYADAAVYLLNTLGAAILLLTTLTVSTLLITNVSFAGFVGSLELARENLMVHFNEWRDKRKRAKELLHAQAVERGEKRKEARSGKFKLETPATLVVGEEAPKAAGKARGATVGGAFVTTSSEAEARTTSDPVVPTILNVKKPRSGSDVPDTVVSDVQQELFGAGENGEAGPGTKKNAAGKVDKNAAEAKENAGDPGQAGEPAKAFDEYELPHPDFLHPPDAHIEQKEAELQQVARELSAKTSEFNVAGKVMHICPGPVVTTYEFKPDPGVKYSRVTGLVDDLCLALKAESIRIDRIPGKAFVGIEVPNKKRETIRLRDVIESRKFKESESLLTLALGKTIDGLNYVTDLAKMPHLLIAGATGAGKSVGVNTLVVSILYRAKPDEVKFIMVDPKRLELGVYADIPHLITPIITDPKRAAAALKWAVGEMERRYKYLAGLGVRNIDGYNAEVKRRSEIGQLDENGEPYQKLPFIVCIIDELADLMMVSGKEVEESITRLAQMARAVGIHLVLATQRPSVDVITGLIKANFPARIAFRVSQKVDSRTIIDSNGAESLLGRGDMLFLPPASSQVVRVHGAFVDEKEIAAIVNHIKAQVVAPPVYDESITKTDDDVDESETLPGKSDPLFWDAVRSVVNARRASTSLLQRHLRIGYGRAAAILDAMVREGYIGEMDGTTRARPVLDKAFADLQDVVEMNEHA
ncbi:MAG: DNA translocase FtsK [Chloracidobacterium sp.]|nr:DNA translocase FtsK [Chloracidobacterium sp.]